MHNSISAVLREELAPFLEKVGLLEDVQNGKVVCHRCGCLVTMDNFGAVARNGRELLVFCGMPTCQFKPSGKCAE